MSQTIFRPAALRRVSSPEQLDKAVRITLPRQWLALAALVVVVAVGVAWSALSNVPTLIPGPGYLLPREGLDSIASPVSGTVTRLSLHAGQLVTAGQRVGTVRGVAGESVPLVAAASGRVTEVDDGPGAYAAPGQRLALIEPTSAPRVVYAYVPIRQAHGLPPGLPVRVTFHAGIGAAYGYVEGRVASVSRYPVSRERLWWVLQNRAELARVQGLAPVDEVVVTLTRSARSGGLVWGSGSGPPGGIPSGVSADVHFVLGTHHPIDDVL